MELAPSAALGGADMLSIARKAIDALAGGPEGVVVTHGTDTLELTAFLTDVLLGEAASLGPIVFTGAMRFASDPDSDGPGNLADAIRLAADPTAEGLGGVVCFAGDIHAARWVTKRDTQSDRPFSSDPFDPIGHIDAEATTIDVRPPRRWPRSSDAELRVGVVRAYPGMSDAGLNALVDEGARGIVIEGFGAMNVPSTLYPSIGRAVSNDVVVVVASRARTSGGLDQGPVGHRSLHDLGAIGSYGLSADKAWVALMVGLVRPNHTPDDLRAWLLDLSGTTR